jgi:hypothetical protein
MSPELRQERLRLVRRLKSLADELGHSRIWLAGLMKVSESAVYDWWRAANGNASAAVPCGPSVREVNEAIKLLREEKQSRDEQQRLPLAPPPAPAPQPGPPRLQTPLARKDFTQEQAIAFRHLYWHRARLQIEYVRRHGERIYRGSMGTNVWERAAEARDVYERTHGLPPPSARGWQRVLARNGFSMAEKPSGDMLQRAPKPPARLAPTAPPPAPISPARRFRWLHAHLDELGAAAALGAVTLAVLAVEFWR